MIRNTAINGFSILEFYTVLGIATLLFLMAVPNYKQVMMQSERELTLERLQIAIEFAKQESYRLGKPVTLCASFNQKTCHKGPWTTSFIVVAGSSILQTYPKLKYGTLQFENFGQFIQFRPGGESFNGTITYCPNTNNRDMKEARALIMNKAGRVYRPIKKNILGVFEKEEGTPEAKPLTCR